MDTGNETWAPDMCTRISDGDRVLFCWHTCGNSDDRDADHPDSSLVLVGVMNG